MSFAKSGAPVMPSSPVAIRPKRSRPQLRLLECCWPPEQAETLILSRIALRHVADIFDGLDQPAQAEFFEDALNGLEEIIVDARHLQNEGKNFLDKWNSCIGIIQEQFEMPQLFTQHLEEAEFIFTAYIAAETKLQATEPQLKSKPSFVTQALRYTRFGLAAILIAHNPQTAFAAYVFASEVKAWVNGDIITDGQVLRYFHSNPVLCASGDRGEIPTVNQFALAKSQLETEAFTIIIKNRRHSQELGQAISGDVSSKEISAAVQQRLSELEGKRPTSLAAKVNTTPSINVLDWQGFTSPCCLTSSGQIVFIRRKRDEPTSTAKDGPTP